MFDNAEKTVQFTGIIRALVCYEYAYRSEDFGRIASVVSVFVAAAGPLGRFVMEEQNPFKLIMVKVKQSKRVVFFRYRFLE